MNQSDPEPAVTSWCDQSTHSQIDDVRMVSISPTDLPLTEPSSPNGSRDPRIYLLRINSVIARAPVPAQIYVV